MVFRVIICKKTSKLGEYKKDQGQEGIKVVW